MNLNRYFLCAFFLSALLIISCQDKKEGQSVVATINDSRISMVELQKEVSIYSKREPASKITPQIIEEQLKTMIEKKLMIQEAMKMGIAEDEKFAETIKKLWEQTLIRELINAKNKEWADRLFVAEDEIQKHYRRMQCTYTLKIAKAETKERAESVKQKMLKGKRVEGEETVASCFYEDIKPSPWLKALDMKAGEVGVFDSDGEYVIVKVVAKGNIPIPPLKDIYGRIKESLLDQKKQRAMMEWMEALKKSSKINVNTKLLKDAGHGQ